MDIRYSTILEYEILSGYDIFLEDSKLINVTHFLFHRKKYLLEIKAINI